MAEIRIEEKNTRGGSIWPWIVGLLVLALVIWGIAEAFDESEEVYTEEVYEDDDEVAGVATGVDENNNYNDYEAPAVEEEDYATSRDRYLRTTENLEGEMGLGHEYSHRALTELVMTTKSLAREKGLMSDAMVKQKTERVDRLANDIMKDPMAGDHADKIKMAAMLITEMLEDINEKTDGDNEEALDKLRQEAQAIDAATLTLDQKMDIRSFFQQARTVLERMS